MSGWEALPLMTSVRDGSGAVSERRKPHPAAGTSSMLTFDEH